MTSKIVEPKPGDYKQKAYKPRTEEQARRWATVAAHHAGQASADLIRVLIDQEYYRIIDGQTKGATLKQLQADSEVSGKTLAIILSLLWAVAVKLGALPNAPDKAEIAELYAQLTGQGKAG